MLFKILNAFTLTLVTFTEEILLLFLCSECFINVEVSHLFLAKPKTRKPQKSRKSRKIFLKFSNQIQPLQLKSKTRNNFSEISKISDFSEFSICHFFIFFLNFFSFFIKALQHSCINETWFLVFMFWYIV